MLTIFKQHRLSEVSHCRYPVMCSRMFPCEKHTLFSFFVILSLYFSLFLFNELPFCSVSYFISFLHCPLFLMDVERKAVGLMVLLEPLCNVVIVVDRVTFRLCPQEDEVELWSQNHSWSEVMYKERFHSPGTAGLQDRYSILYRGIYLSGKCVWWVAGPLVNASGLQCSGNKNK